MPHADKPIKMIGYRKHSRREITQKSSVRLLGAIAATLLATNLPAADLPSQSEQSRMLASSLIATPDVQALTQSNSAPTAFGAITVGMLAARRRLVNRA